jgi:hypothetical protein
MHYFFLDESYPPAAQGQKKVVMAAWAVEQHTWSPNAAARFDLFKPPIMKRICAMFESLGAPAVAATATLEESLFRAGEIDGTDDVPSMARPDLIWSMSVIFVLGNLVLELLKQNRQVGTIDVHFDPKSLKFAHSEVWKRTLQQLVVREAKRFASQLGLQHLKKFRIRRVEPVMKPSVGQVPDKFQMGTWVADKLCSHFGEIEALKECSRIQSHEMTESVRRTIQQFDGKSFYES